MRSYRPSCPLRSLFPYKKGKTTPNCPWNVSASAVLLFPFLLSSRSNCITDSYVLISPALEQDWEMHIYTMMKQTDVSKSSTLNTTVFQIHSPSIFVLLSDNTTTTPNSPKSHNPWLTSLVGTRHDAPHTAHTHSPRHQHIYCTCYNQLHVHSKNKFHHTWNELNKPLFLFVLYDKPPASFT